MDAMQTRETQTNTRVSIKEPDEIRKRIKRGGYDVKIWLRKIC